MNQMLKVTGPWKQGFCFDTHTVSSKCLGENEYGYPVYETVRSEMGRQLYILKYKPDINALPKIVSLLEQSDEFKAFIAEIDVILPVPPSIKSRGLQPVVLVACEIARVFNKELKTDVLMSTNSEPIKNIDTHEKYPKVKESMVIGNGLEKSRRILVFDDIFDSGSTLKAFVDGLIERGYVDLSVFTLTKTRKSD